MLFVFSVERTMRQQNIPRATVYQFSNMMYLGSKEYEGKVQNMSNDTDNLKTT